MRIPVFLAAGAATVAACLTPAAIAAATTAGPALTVDVISGRHVINPDIYGMNFADPALETELGLTADRWGGNSTSRYNYQNNTYNTGSDYYFENVADGQLLDSFVSGDLSRGTQPVVTVPMTGWVAKNSPASHPFACGFKVSKYGAQQSTDGWDSDCGNGVHTNGANIRDNDPADTSISAGASFVQGMVSHLVSQHGSAAGGGVRTYELDNEPSLWNSTHRDVHPAALTYDELWQKSRDTAVGVKAADSAAQVAGPGDWGWCAYFFSAADPGGCSDGADRQAHSDLPMAAWYLQQFHAYEQQHGQRLLDVFDEHFYPQENGVALASAGDANIQALRLRSTRTLWDPSYTDESWTNDLGLGAVDLIPRMKQWRDTYSPGTKLSISEYNWGGLESINGALAQADVLGIFGREGLDRALLWAPPSSSQPGAFAFRIYRNYDGSGSRFGDIGVQATSADQSKLAVYASQRSTDNAVTAVVVNKNSGDLTSALSLSGSNASSAQVWTYSASDPAHIVRGTDTAVSGNELTHTYPANSITLLVLPQSSATPTALTASASPAVTKYAAPATLTGALTSAGAGVGGAPVIVEAMRAGTTAWTTLGSANSVADGWLQWAGAVPWSAKLRWRYAGGSTYAPSLSPAAAITVLAALSARASPSAVTAGQPVTISGVLSPAHPGSTVSVQALIAHRWRTIAQPTTSATGAYAVATRPLVPGTQDYRVTWAGDVDHGAASSSVIGVTVR
ncbi:MAG: glycoside hydrolase family 44 protein [Actinomycetes bacterium]